MRHILPYNHCIMYDKRNQQWTVADEASSHSKEASAKDYIRVHVGGIAGKLVILPLASTHQLLYNDIEKGNMPETMSPPDGVGVWNFNMHHELGIPYSEKNLNKGDTLRHDFYILQKPSLTVDWLCGRLDPTIQAELAKQPPNHFRGRDSCTIDWHWYKDMSNQLREPELEMVIDDVVRKTHQHITITDEALQHGIKIDDRALREPIRRIKRQTDLATIALKNLMTDKYLDKMRHWQRPELPSHEREENAIRAKLEAMYGSDDPDYDQ